MKFAFEPANLTIIYAEDEFVFREIAIPAIMKAGILRENIHTAEDGLQALEHLERLQDAPHTPLVMLLDVRMPNMDGNQCAARVQEMVAEKSLKREPFMVCCSAGVKKVSFEDAGAFSIVMPKPFGKAEVELCLQKTEEWWESQPGGEDTAGKHVQVMDCDPKAVDLIVADDEPICRMAVLASLSHIGADEKFISEAEDDEETIEVLRESQSGDLKRPLIVLLGNPSWMSAITQIETAKRKPFFICTSVDSDRINDSTFDAYLPRQFQQADLKVVLAKCWNLFHN